MTTKIEGVQTPALRPSSAAGKAVSRPTGATSSAGSDVAAVAGADRVKLSDEAADLAAVQKQLAEAPSIDVARVAAVRSLLESGGYKINPEEIARRLAQLERELGG